MKLILEDKNIQDLFHYTSIDNLIDILLEDKLKSKYGVISFSRRSDLVSFKDWSVYNECVIVLDGNKLSNRYKIKPTMQTGSRFEAEEIIKTKSIDNLSAYIIKIIIDEKFIPTNKIINNTRLQNKWENNNEYYLDILNKSYYNSNTHMLKKKDLFYDVINMSNVKIEYK